MNHEDAQPRWVLSHVEAARGTQPPCFVMLGVRLRTGIWYIRACIFPLLSSPSFLLISTDIHPIKFSLSPDLNTHTPPQLATTCIHLPSPSLLFVPIAASPRGVVVEGQWVPLSPAISLPLFLAEAPLGLCMATVA